MSEETKSTAKPCNNYVLVLESQSEERSAGGIIMADTALDHRKAEVISVGPGIYSTTGQLIPMRVSAGNTVLYRPGAGMDMKLDNVEYRLIREDELLMVVS
jgi:chaperonin GroES